MRLTVTSVDYAPEDLYGQVPITIDLIRQIPGDDRPDYWLGTLARPIRWVVNDQTQEVTHVVVGARLEGRMIAAGLQGLPINIAYVTDQSVLDDAHLDFLKSAYKPVGTASETSGHER